MKMTNIDIIYLGLLSNNLRNFKKKSENVWNFSCPLCGDSKKKISKARGYIYTKKNKLFYHCHNCSVNISFSNFLKQVNNLLYNDYRIEKYKITQIETSIPPPKISFIQNNYLSDCTNLADLDSDHIAIQYCLKRKLPKEKLKHLYYVPDFKKWTNTIIPNKFPNIHIDEPRIIIPFFNRKKNLIGYQGRSLDNNKIRYYNVRIIQNEKMMFGIERIDFEKPIYVVEGALDSLFLNNAIAVSNSCLIVKDIPKEKLILVPDNSPRSKEICKLMNGYIFNNYKLCIWDRSIKEKDINEMVLAGYNDIEYYINKYSYVGLTAKLMFDDWKQC